ncbi:Vacuolar protein sorting-associated protein ist1 [Kappamyces sp. JEL0680]|nr:Vacuolar protein sorting-associated protein ist1 [Kappamyces sp. JEL0680]
MKSFDGNKCKVQLKLALNRLMLVQQKKTAINQNMRREIGMLLKAGKTESARIRVEHIIREDFLVEALELLHLYADTLLARDLDAGISEAVHALVYAAPRVDIAELTVIRDQLISKYGRDLQDRTNSFASDFVNPRIIHKLSISTPDPKLVTQYLKTIAQAYGVEWEDDFAVAEALARWVGGSDDRPAVDDRDFVVPSAPSHAEIRDSLAPTAPVRASNGTLRNEDDVPEPDFDSLAKRFESLRKK